MVEDQETQRRGIVTILLIKCNSEVEKEEVNKFFHSSLKDLATRVYSWCPLKCHAHHHWIHEDSSATGHIEFMQSFDTSASKRTQSKENDDDSGASALSSSLIKSGSAILDSIMRYFGKEYRIRTRLHEGRK